MGPTVTVDAPVAAPFHVRRRRWRATDQRRWARMSAKSGKPLGLLIGSWAVAVVAMCVVVAALWISREPTYSDRSLSYWFQRLPVLSGKEGVVGFVPTVASPSIAENRAALAAIRAIGTNGLPFLISKLQGRPPPRLITLIQRYAGDWPVISTFLPVRDVRREQGQALAGLLMLCALPPDAEKRVRVMALNFNGHSWFAAGYVLKANRDPQVVREALKPYLE